MKQIPVSLSELYNRRLPLGRVGENVHVQIVFQCSAIFSEFPNASTTLIVTAPGGESYAPEIEKDGTNILWTVTDSDLAKDGGGELQLTFKDGNEKIKSYIGKTQIFRSLAENGEVPTPIGIWIEKANETVRQAAQEAAEATVEDLAEEKDAAIAEIQEQETATETAIAQAAAAARASIPGEYRQLSDDVTGLKSAITKRAEVKDSTGTGIDLDIADSDGNVIVRLKDGHIRTKNFNSEENEGIKNSTETGIDLDVSDPSGNVIARFANGGIETNGFKGYKYIEFKKAGTTTNQSITVTIHQNFKRGDRIVLHTDRGTYPYNAPWNTGVAVTYYEDDRPIISDARIDVAYIEHTITEDTSSISVEYDGTLSSGSQTVMLHVYLLGDIPITPNVIRVKTDGTGDYTSLRDAVDAIGLDADDFIHPYVIEVYPGTYDVLADYDDEEINTAVSSFNDTSFVGLKLLNGVSLIGVGNPDNIILTASLSTTDYTSEVRGGISTINKQGSGSIENVTIVSRNLRYCVHDDFGSQKAKRIKRIYKNCIFRAYNSAYTPDTSYGAGMPIGGMDAEFINCDFGENGGLHLNSQLTSFVTERFVNCKGLGFRIGDNTTVTNSTISEYIFENCDFEHIYYGMSGETPHVHIRGSGNKPVMINAPDSVMYAMDSVVPVPIDRLNADVGDVVERYAANTHGPRYQAATSVDKACGIVVFKDSDDVYIQTAGYVKTDRTGLSSFNLNDYVGLNNGVPAVVQNADDAFGRIKFIDSDSNGYIYLNWR